VHRTGYSFISSCVNVAFVAFVGPSNKPRSDIGLKLGRDLASSLAPKAALISFRNSARARDKDARYKCEVTCKHYENLMQFSTSNRKQTPARPLDFAILLSVVDPVRFALAGGVVGFNNGRASNESELWDSGDRSEGRP
jgi:hypothetical protein